MRLVICNVCREEIGRVDLRSSVGGDPLLLQAQELAVGFAKGNIHVVTEHTAVSLLRLRKEMSLDPLIKVGEFNPADSQSRLENTSRVRR